MIANGIVANRVPVEEQTHPPDALRLLRLARDRRGEGTSQRGQQEAAAVHYSMT
jgi:hypothetical protein